MSFRTRRKYRGCVSVLTLLGRLTTIARDLSTFCKVKLMFNYIIYKLFLNFNTVLLQDIFITDIIFNEIVRHISLVATSTCTSLTNRLLSF